MTLLRTGAGLLCCLFVIAMAIGAAGVIGSRLRGKK
jgi:hypothetical protein